MPGSDERDRVHRFGTGGRPPFSRGRSGGSRCRITRGRNAASLAGRGEFARVRPPERRQRRSRPSKRLTIRLIST